MDKWISGLWNRVACMLQGHPVRVIAETNILYKCICERCGTEFIGNKELPNPGRCLLKWHHSDPTLKFIFDKSLTTEGEGA